MLTLVLLLFLAGVFGFLVGCLTDRIWSEKLRRAARLGIDARTQQLIDETAETRRRLHSR